MGPRRGGWEWEGGLLGEWPCLWYRLMCAMCHSGAPPPTLLLSPSFPPPGATQVPPIHFSPPPLPPSPLQVPPLCTLTVWTSLAPLQPCAGPCWLWRTMGGGWTRSASATACPSATPSSAAAGTARGQQASATHPSRGHLPVPTLAAATATNLDHKTLVISSPEPSRFLHMYIPLRQYNLLSQAFSNNKLW